jgi:dihydroxy-acid dehydratase
MMVSKERAGVELRSKAWFGGDDEVALENRAAMRSAGIDPGRGDRPVIGIANTASDLNPCNLPARQVIDDVKAGVREGGGVAVEFPVMSLGEDLMKPTAMLYRDLMAVEIEETVRAYPIDGLILLVNCDKTVPGGLLGAISADVATLVVPLGPRPPATFRGRKMGSGTGLWRLWDERRSGLLDDEAWSEAEASFVCGPGACNTMGTASTMAILSEVLGFCLPGTSTAPAGSAKARAAARQAGRRIVAMVREHLVPSRLLSEEGLANSLVVLNAIGGSTNAIIHLAAIARRRGFAFDLLDVDRLGRDVPLLVDVEPNGSGLIQDFDQAGGFPTLARVLGGMLDGSQLMADGRRLKEVADGAPGPAGVIRPLERPLLEGGSFRVVKGSLAPKGAVIRRSTASLHLLRHQGRAVVLEDPAGSDLLEEKGVRLDASSVVVLRGCGPVGTPGMPEWGMVPVPRQLLRQGISDLVRVTDARMSGTSFGTVVLHVAPEAAVGGPIALVRDGDLIELDADAGRIDLRVSEDEFARRRESWEPPLPRHRRGWPALFARHVRQAPEGCGLDFLEPETEADLGLVEPIVGRS